MNCFAQQKVTKKIFLITLNKILDRAREINKVEAPRDTIISRQMVDNIDKIIKEYDT